MPLLTVSQVLEFFEDADLPESAVQMLIDEADDAIVKKHGPHSSDGDITVERRGDGTQSMWLNPLAESVVSVEYTNDDQWTALDDDAYALEMDGGLLRRKRAQWSPYFVYRIVYTPKSDDLHERRMALVDLVRLGLQNQGLITSERSGNYQANYESYEKARLRVLNRIGRFAPGSSFA